MAVSFLEARTMLNSIYGGGVVGGSVLGGTVVGGKVVGGRVVGGKVVGGTVVGGKVVGGSVVGGKVVGGKVVGGRVVGATVVGGTVVGGNVVGAPVVGAAVVVTGGSGSPPTYVTTPPTMDRYVPTRIGTTCNDGVASNELSILTTGLACCLMVTWSDPRWRFAIKPPTPYSFGAD
jgi:hypothetical protein